MQNKEEHLKGLLEAFRIDKLTIRALDKKAKVRGLVSLMFFAVISGCELDLLGFAGAWMDYWRMEFQLVRILLVAMPAAYVMVSMMYLCFLAPDDSGDGTPHCTGQGDDQRNRVKQMLSHRPIQLKWYHFLPFCRYLLLIKSIVADDIEAVFRINSLSSFTLGSAQILSMVFKFMSGTELTIFVYINIGSQCVNWFITLLYFMTPVSKRMQSAIGVNAYKGNLTDDMRNDLMKLKCYIREDAKAMTKPKFGIFEDSDDGGSVASSLKDSECSSDIGGKAEKTTQLYAFRMRVTAEVQLILKRQGIDLTAFTPIEIMMIRRLLFFKDGERLAKI